MFYVLAVLILGLVVLEYLGRKQKLSLDENYDVLNRETIEEKLDNIEGLKYTYGKIFACHLENLNLILVPKEEYPKSDQLVIMHEIGHFFHFSKIKDSMIYKILIYSKGLFYMLGILSMFTLVLSLLFNPVLYVFKYLLIALIFIQVIHLLFLAYSETVANMYLSSKFDQEKDAIIYAYISMMSQIFYWLLFIVLTIMFYTFIFL